jgi:hypothetical protein
MFRLVEPSSGNTSSKVFLKLLNCIALHWIAAVWYSILLVPLLHFMAELLQGSTWTGWVIRCIPWSRRYFRTTVQFSKMTMSEFTQLELFSHGLKSMKVNIIFPGQHNHQTWTSLNHSGQFWRLEWGTDSHLQHLWSKFTMFFKTNGIKFRYRQFKTCTNSFREGLQLYWRQKVVQYHINKEMCTVVFPLFCPSPVDKPRICNSKRILASMDHRMNAIFLTISTTVELVLITGFRKQVIVWNSFLGYEYKLSLVNRTLVKDFLTSYLV